jgi:hypothetical protein
MAFPLTDILLVLGVLNVGEECALNVHLICFKYEAVNGKEIVVMV